jgi:hypothetical protein
MKVRYTVPQPQRNLYGTLRKFLHVNDLGPCATKLSVVFSPKAVGNENKLGGFIFY